MKASFLWRIGAVAVGLGALAIPAARAQSPIDVVEEGVGAYEIVNISSSTIGDDWEVYACSLDILIDGIETQGFCIDPWHWSGDGTMVYMPEDLALGPKAPGPMGATVALEIEQLWEEYYSPTMSDSTAAGLQIAIWELITQEVEAVTDGAAWFTLNSGDDYGASSMIAWVEANPDAAAADLVAITGPGQDYVVEASSVPGLPPSATIDAAATAYTGSPFHVTSTATAPDDNLTLHSVEWLAPDGTTWSEDSQAASGGSDNMTTGITFPSTGVWTLRAGASVDNGNTWVYSPSVTVNVTSGLTSYTFESMSVPTSSDSTWYSTSPVVTKTYQVQYTNP